MAAGYVKYCYTTGSWLVTTSEPVYIVRLLPNREKIVVKQNNCIHIDCDIFPYSTRLTHWGQVTPYGDRDLGQHWLR